MGDSQRATDTLKNVFGFKGFREGQEAAISCLLAGKSVLTIFPTGGGKSLCYQLPALLLEGVTLVISPLIALMKDQIDFLVSKGVAAARLDSTQEFSESREVYNKLNKGELKLLYVAPERLASEGFLQTLQRLRIPLMAIDEAHCISEWGHNFRPDYMKLANLSRTLRVGRVLALTATATPAVAKDIAGAFGISADCVVQTGFYRPNLNMHVSPALVNQRRELLLERIRTRPRGPTIVYVTLQRTAEEVAEFLARNDLPAKAYHAGMDNEVRHQVQDWFMGSGDAIVVATIAFGMGIDKRDIRYVYHYNLPKSLENYAQEIGRAGRDGKASVCELFASMEDRVVLENFTFGDTPTREAVASFIDDVLGRGEVFDVSIYDLAFVYDMRPLVVETVLTYLELDGILESTGPFYNEYKFQPLKSSAEIFARFDATRAEFLRGIFRHAQKGKTWFALDVERVARSLNEARPRIVKALNFLEEQGDLMLQVAGARQGYRVKRRPGDLAGLRQAMADRFAHRENRDIARLQQVLEFAGYEGCRTRYLLQYFGEQMNKDCGHCAWCEGHRPGAVPAGPNRSCEEIDGQGLYALRAEKHEALASPRQLARFLCGMNSPKTTRAKLSRHPLFGSLAEVPFGEVMAFAEGRG
ncbi:MAG: ATP-dependent DNA helicase RecQ [Bacillota bacterium]